MPTFFPVMAGPWHPPQPPQPPPLPLGRALVLSNLRVGGGGGHQEGGPGSHRACLYLKLRYFVVQRAFSFRISFCIKILLRTLFISMTVTGALLIVAQDASAFLQVLLSSKDKDSGKLGQDGDGLVHTGRASGSNTEYPHTSLKRAATWNPLSVASSTPEAPRPLRCSVPTRTLPGPVRVS